jgi:hypothetical protein
LISIFEAFSFWKNLNWKTMSDVCADSFEDSVIDFDRRFAAQIAILNYQEPEIF